VHGSRDRNCVAERVRRIERCLNDAGLEHDFALTDRELD